MDRGAEQGPGRPADPAQVPGTDLAPPEMAAPNPDLEKRGAVPGARPNRDQHDGLADGPPPPRPGARGGPLPQGLPEDPPSRSLDPRGRGRRPVRPAPAMPISPGPPS